MNQSLALFWIAVIAGFVLMLLDYLTIQRPKRRRALAAVQEAEAVEPTAEAEGTATGGAGRSAVAAGSVERPWYVKYFWLEILLLFAVLVLFNVVQQREQQFVYLANSFLQGKLYFIEQPNARWGDSVLFEGQRYWPLGPFPAVLLMPVVFVANLLGLPFYQSYPNILLTAGIFLLMYATARQFGYTRSDALFWGFTLPFASVLFGVALWPWSWQFSQVVATFLICLLMYEYLTRRRYWLLGVLLAAILATRINAAFIGVFFGLDVLLAKEPWGDKLRRLVALAVPVGIAGVALLLYNYGRFGSFTEQGYNLQQIPPFLEQTRAHGLFSPIHLPGNLYFFLVSMPEPVFLGDGSQVLRFPYIQANALGMSVFVTSPVVLYFTATRTWDRFTRLLLIGILVVALPVFLYYGIGWRQLGYRYSLDFLPLVFVLLMRNYRLARPTLSTGIKLVIGVSAFVNLYLFWTIFWPR